MQPPWEAGGGGIRVRVSGRCLCDVHPAAAGVLLGADGGEGVHGVGSLTTAHASGRCATVEVLGLAQPLQLS